MTTSISQTRPPTIGAVPRKTPLAAVLAVIGALIVAYSIWTFSAWLADGPHQITAYRDHNDVSWWAARCYEVIMLVLAICLTVYVVRACLRERRLVVDAVIIIAGFFTLIWDPMVNWMQPNFMYSSQWLNVNTWAGNAPWVVNPTADEMPQPFFIFLIYPFGFLAIALIVSAVMRWVKRIMPNIGQITFLFAAGVIGTVVGIILEAPIFLLHLWSLPGAPRELSLFGNNARYPWAEFLTTGMVFAVIGCVRYFKDDKGQTIGERGLEGFGNGMRSIIRILSTTAIFGIAMFVLLLVQIPAGLHADPYPTGYPKHLVTTLCDVFPDQHTEYGPCPGSPGFRMPVKQTFTP